MAQMREEWRFLRLRAYKLFEEGDAKGALRLLKAINAEQIRLLEKTEEKYEQTENC